jgi:hypothetical protein
LHIISGVVEFAVKLCSPLFPNTGFNGDMSHEKAYGTGGFIDGDSRL